MHGAFSSSNLCCSSQIYLQDDIIHGRERNDVQVKLPRLNEKAVLQCLKGRDALTRKFLDIAKGWLHRSDLIPASTSYRKNMCLKRNVAVILDLPAFDLNFLCVLRPLGQESPPSLCSECNDALVAVYNETRREMWSKSPTYFGLPNWE